MSSGLKDDITPLQIGVATIVSFLGTVATACLITKGTGQSGLYPYQAGMASIVGFASGLYTLTKVPTVITWSPS